MVGIKKPVSWTPSLGSSGVLAACCCLGLSVYAQSSRDDNSRVNELGSVVDSDASVPHVPAETDSQVGDAEIGSHMDSKDDLAVQQASGGSESDAPTAKSRGSNASPKSDQSRLGDTSSSETGKRSENDDGFERRSDSRDDAIFGDADAIEEKSVETEDQPKKGIVQDMMPQAIKDRLQVGGLVFFRFNWRFSDGSRNSDHPISMPNLVDVYLDARPNDRVRAFVRGRLLWDPTVDESSPAAEALGTKQTRVVLNELWLKFDILRRLFVTIGNQRVLWGTTRLWNPVDFINQSLRPVLSPFDGRNGVPMVKMSLPIESLGWNFYAVGLLEQANQWDRYGVVGRAEFLWRTIELGITGAYRKGSDPRLGFDISAGIWDFDLSSELGLRFDDQYASGVAVQTSAGLQYGVRVFDDDTLYLGGEYFYNQLGSDDPNPLDIFTGTVQFFYAGKHYGSLFASLPSPAKLDRWTFTLSTVGNFSDQSFLTRLDVSVSMLTYLRIQAFVVGHYGKAGELRLGDAAFPAELRETARQFISPGQPERRIPNEVIDLGLWLSVDL